MSGSRSRKPHAGVAASGRPTDPVVSDEEDLVAIWHQAATEEARAEAFRAIYARFYPRVLRFFLYRGFASPESEDFTQETFLRIYKGLAQFRGGGPFAVWVFEIATNVYSNTVRERMAQKRRGTEIALDEGDLSVLPSTGEHDFQPIDQVLAREQQACVQRAIQALPPQMRRCVLLRVDQDLKYREIAALLQISIETVKAHLFQARQKLKDELRDSLGEIDL